VRFTLRSMDGEIIVSREEVGAKGVGQKRRDRGKGSGPLPEGSPRL